MSFILAPRSGDNIQINAWNWRPTVELLRTEDLIADEHFERLGTNGYGADVDAKLAERIAAMLDKKLLGMKPGERMLANLSVTTRARREFVLSADIEWTEGDINELYSTTYEWLADFRDFCRRSGGFTVS